MPRVWIPPLLRDLSAGRESLSVPGASVAEIIDELEIRYPGIRSRLCVGDALRPGLAVVVGSEVARAGLRQPVAPGDEVHFVQAIGGGVSG